MTKKELDGIAYAVRTTKKKKGADHGYKFTYEKVWSGVMTRSEYLTRLEAIDARACGLFLCDIEHREMLEDRYWDTEDYRAEAIRAYREKITAFRRRYGLTKSEVARFMRVA